MNIYDFTLNELEKYLVDAGYKKFNATQIIEWMYDKKEYDFNKMSNLSKSLIAFLNENFVIKTPKIIIQNQYYQKIITNN